MSLARTLSLWADLERIDSEAHRVRLGSILMTAIAAVLYALGWLGGKAFSLTGLVARWVIAALAIGWRDARAPTRGPEG
jgi:hypothetical protein